MPLKPFKNAIIYLKKLLTKRYLFVYNSQWHLSKYINPFKLAETVYYEHDYL